MQVIKVKTSAYNSSMVEISVEKELFWSNGRPYTLEDYVITNINNNK